MTNGLSLFDKSVAFYIGAAAIVFCLIFWFSSGWLDQKRWRWNASFWPMDSFHERRYWFNTIEWLKAIFCHWDSWQSVLVTPSHVAWCDKRRRHAKVLSRESKTTNTFLHRCMKKPRSYIQYNNGDCFFVRSQIPAFTTRFYWVLVFFGLWSSIF